MKKLQEDLKPFLNSKRYNYALIILIMIIVTTSILIYKIQYLEKYNSLLYFLILLVPIILCAGCLFFILYFKSKEQ